MLWIWSLPIAFILDLILGDPPWLPHPVRWIGLWARICEKWTRRFPFPELFSGVLFWVCVVIPCLLLPLIILNVATHIHIWLARFLEIWILYQGIALRDLLHEVKKIFNLLHEKDIAGARIACSRIVSRSTDGMDEAALSRSAVESASENGVDGVISPLFWAALLGPAGLWAFKAASTLDSLVGYRSPQYEMFGKFSAKMDDVLNWIPARISLLFYSLAAFPSIPKMIRTMRISLRDHSLHASPNSGWSEAAAAGYLGTRLGGPAVYQGKLTEKPWFGREFRDANKNDILRCIKLVSLSSTYFLLIIVLFLTHVNP